VWVAVPGARRRVFYFAAVISWRVAGEKKFRKEFPKQVARQLRHEAKFQRKLGKTELEGEIAQRDRIRPTRQVPSQLIWRDREAVK
jgi:hypothetical protein